MKNKSKVFTVIVILLCLINLLLAGCNTAKQDAQTQAKQQKGLDVVKIPDIHMPTYLYSPYIADEKGFFAEEGIKPQFTGMIPPGQHVAAVASGTNDVGYLHVNRTIAGIAGGAKMRAVAADTVTTKEFPHMEFVVLENSPLKKPTDIIGKKVGIIAMGGCNEYTPYEILAKNGISDPKGKFEFVVIPIGNEEQALRSGQVDVVGYHGHPAEVFKRGGLRILFSDYDIWGSTGGSCPWYFSEKFIKENPDVVRRFVRAMAKTTDWINAHQQEAIEIQAKRLNFDANKIVPMYFAEHAIIKEDTVQVWIDILKKYGEISDFSPNDIYTNEFNDYVKK
jgi:ABC-type nitrate/sulfonate/bicarbonate transport system substrate-binding protein